MPDVQHAVRLNAPPGPLRCLNLCRSRCHCCRLPEPAAPIVDCSQKARCCRRLCLTPERQRLPAAATPNCSQQRICRRRRTWP
eukprot:360633-Chlamydomonas_euryale.AAC.22